MGIREKLMFGLINKNYHRICLYSAERYLSESVLICLIKKEISQSGGYTNYSIRIDI